MLVYPRIGHLTRRWFQIQRQATENRQGQRHDSSAQQVEYHGLRGYRSGDSPRWIHWRTSARRGELMVKEFEHQNEQDLAILIDPWLPRARASAEQRETIEQAISFAATLCVETARHQGRRIVLGWTGAAPGVRQGPASVKLLHELLEQLAVMTPVSEGGLAELFDVMPPAVLREALLVIVSTRPINLIEEAERSSRFSGTSARGLLGRVMMLNATQGDLSSLFQFDDETARDLLQQRQSSAIQDRRSSQDRAPPRFKRRRCRAGTPPADARPREITDREQLPRLSRKLLPDALRRHHGLERRQPRGTVCQAPRPGRRGRRGRRLLHRRSKTRCWLLPRQLANILAVCTLGVLYFEYRLDDTQRIPALAHWLVYLQLIKYFLPKTAEDDWFLFLLGLMQVLIGSVVNQSDQVGTWLFLWAMLAVWVLGQFFLQREALRFSGAMSLESTPRQPVSSGIRCSPRRSLSGPV